MPQPGKAARGPHVHYDRLDPLPAPLTTQNLLPRFHKALGRPARNLSTTSSSSRLQTPTSSPQATSVSPLAEASGSVNTRHPHSTMESSSDSEDEYSNSRGPGRGGKRRRTENLGGVPGFPHVRPLERGESDDRMNISGGPSLFLPPPSPPPPDESQYPNVEEFDLSGRGFPGSSTAIDASPDRTITSAPAIEPSQNPAQTSSSPSRSPVSSPSLARILNAEDVEVKEENGKGKGKAKERASSKGKGRATSKGKGKAKALPDDEAHKKEEDDDRALSPSTKPTTKDKPKADAEPLSDYTCPICFFPPQNATLTPCGHICCGSCLFTAVKSTQQRGIAMRAEDNRPKCPVCRAELVDWDGKGGGVIGLIPRTCFSL